MLKKQFLPNTSIKIFLSKSPAGPSLGQQSLWTLSSTEQTALDGHHPAELVLNLSRLNLSNPVEERFAHGPHLVQATIDRNHLLQPTQYTLYCNEFF